MNRFQTLVFLAAPFFALACSSASEDAPEEFLGEATVALTQVPSDVGCIRMTIVGTRTITRSFDVAAGQSSVLSVNTLPLGRQTFSAGAFTGACSTVAATATAAWVSDPVSADLVLGTAANVALTMRRNGRANVSIDFAADEGVPTGGGTADGGAPLAPSSITITPSSYDFGTVTGSSTRNVSLTVTNVGGVPTGPLAPRLTGTPADNWALETASSGCFDRSLLPAETCVLVVRFTPQQILTSGERTATVVVSSPTSNSVAAQLRGSRLL